MENSNDNTNNTESTQPETNSDSNNEATNENSKLIEQVQKLQNDYLYLKADFENYKKRAIKEKSDVMKYGSESLVIGLLDLMDNFERALSMEVKAENLQSFVEGVKMISGEFKNTLQRFGVQEVPAQGVAFDPNYHEALGSEPTTDVPVGHIVRVFSKPYKLHDRLVRPGKVVIATEVQKQ